MSGCSIKAVWESRWAPRYTFWMRKVTKLYRLAKSPHGARFVLKGATLFTVWTGQPHRATRDVDLLGFGDLKIVPDSGLPGTVLKLQGAGIWLLGLDGAGFHELFAPTREALSLGIDHTSVV